VIVDVIVNGPGEGEVLRNAVARRVTLVKGALPHLSVFEYTIEGPYEGDRHTHDAETDTFYVLEGELDFHVDGKTFRGGPGTFVAAPPGVVHTFGKSDAGPVRFLNIHAPGGFEHALREMSDPT
jgi:quercetin dioxygenase-like cupin family protein